MAKRPESRKHMGKNKLLKDPIDFTESNKVSILDKCPSDESPSSDSIQNQQYVRIVIEATVGNRFSVSVVVQ